MVNNCLRVIYEFYKYQIRHIYGMLRILNGRKNRDVAAQDKVGYIFRGATGRSYLFLDERSFNNIITGNTNTWWNLQTSLVEQGTGVL